MLTFATINGAVEGEGHGVAVALRDWRRRARDYLFLRRDLRGLFATGIGRHRHRSRSGPCADLPKALALNSHPASEFRAAAFQAAVSKARELGWIV